MSIIRAAAAVVVVGLGSMMDQRTSAVTYYLATDVPSMLGGADYAPNQIVRRDPAAFVLELVLPAGTELGSLDRRPDGVWLFSPAHPVMLGGANYEPRDLVSYDGVSFSMFLDGSAAGIPDYARVDSVLRDSAGALVFSFDVPVTLGGVEYSRSDLVRYGAGAFSSFWDAEAAGVPAYANVVGAARDGSGAPVVTFDVPTSVGGTDFMPGELVRWTGTGFSSYYMDPSWPPYAQLRDFAFVPGAGSVPDGGAAPGTPLMVSASGGNLTLTWGASCASGDTDFEVYEGTAGLYYSHTLKFCDTGGSTTRTFALPSGSKYYLVVPRNSLREGSYGRSSSGMERPQGISACMPQEVIAECP